MKKTVLYLSIILLAGTSYGQQKQEVLDYIARYKDIALAEMVRSKIPASITLAQGIHESDCGKSPLASQANNHFGIKCKDEWQGQRYYKNDDAPNECFRVYDHASASYADHSDFLTNHSRYASLFQLPITDYKSWALGLKAAGYATNPRYPQILIGTIETYNLAQYDQIGLAMMKDKQSLNAPATAYQTQNAQTPTNINQNNNATVKPAAKAEERKVFLDFSNSSNGSRKEYVVNGVRTLVAKANEDPAQIAIDYNLDYSHILSFNDMGQGDKFREGEYIFLQPKRMFGPDEKYVAKPGESMRDISQKFGIKLRDLYARNLMQYTEYEQIEAGDTVYLQQRRANAPHTMTYANFLKSRSAEKKSETATNGSKTEGTLYAPVNYQPAKPLITNPTSQYKVQESDTLYSIAQRFNLSVQQLMSMNNLQDTNIHAGQSLQISR